MTDAKPDAKTEEAKAEETAPPAPHADAPNFSKLKSVTDHIPDDNLWPELPQTDKKDMLVDPQTNSPAYALLEAVLRSKNMGKDDATGKDKISDFYIARCATEDGVLFTTILGGTVIMPKVAALIDGNLLPVVFRVTRPGRYYDIH